MQVSSFRSEGGIPNTSAIQISDSFTNDHLRDSSPPAQNDKQPCHAEPEAKSLSCELKEHDRWSDSWGGGYAETFIVLNKEADILSVNEKLKNYYLAQT